MRGKTPKPGYLQLLEGNKNRRTKEQLKDIAKSEIKLGGKKFKASEMIKADAVALKKWKSLIKTYLDYDIDFISDSDSGAIEQYCMSYAMVVRLEKAKAEIMDEGKKKGKKNIEIIAYIDKLDIQKAIDTQVKIMLPLSDRLFLNPVSKIKGLRKKQEPKIDKTNKYEKQFGEI